MKTPVSYNAVHEKACRAICLALVEDPLLASTGLDGKLCVSSLKSDAVIVSFQLFNNAAGWSCCFSPIDSSIIYVGSLNRKLFIYDLRVPGGFVKELQVAFEGPPLPLHSLIAVGNLVFGASLNGIFRLDPADDSIITYSQTSGCFSLAFNGASFLFASFRKGNMTEHCIYSSDSFERLYSFSLPSPNTRLVSLSAVSVSDDVALVATIDEPSTSVLLWQINLKLQDHMLWQRLPINAPVYSTFFFGNADLLAVSDNSLHYFKANRAVQYA
jgi:WD40 repeat protein